MLISDFPDTRYFYKRETEFTEKVSHYNLKDVMTKEILKIVYDFQKKKYTYSQWKKENNYKDFNEEI